MILYNKKDIFTLFKNALKSTANNCDAWHLYSLVGNGNGSYHSISLLRMLEYSLSLSRIHSLVFICLLVDGTAVAD